MNISAYILEYLKRHGSVTVAGFGVFYLENSKAKLDPENGSILPPSSQIAFKVDYLAESDDLISNIASQKGIAFEAAKNELQIQTDFWKKKLQADHTLEIQNIGRIDQGDNGLAFFGKRLASDHPDFYGLEEIRFSDISDGEKLIEASTKEKDYKFSKSILWIFLAAIPVAGLIYLGIAQKELLFGNQSFDSLSAQTKTKRIEKTVPVQLDSAQIKIADSLKRAAFKADSLKTDSLKKDSIRKHTPRKWYPKKRKSKWQK
ncbi:HU domain-containing protein [Chryseobacterium caseinilyticum]|uniref:CCDC81-like prokaryotic HU domain-containing protein n=1 Tax=Chryseobacterium caseinilyticum TaxID=2771428 RepID=A0ABR8ZED2_9FLAO|nr:hypothetical protein [Chryseobacterium caseinilyticum]MBD8083628.1 hypothetical protein [Chryseobacterium caseinilyticum]